MRRLLVLIPLALVPASPAFAASSAPTGLTAASTRDGRVQLAWQPVHGALRYEVYRTSSASSMKAVRSGGSFTGATPVAARPSPRFTDASVADGERAYYTVKAVGMGTSAASDPVRVTARAASCEDPNPVVAENCLPGTTNWKTHGNPPVSAGGIEGFATRTSIEAGESADLKIDTETGKQYRVEVYRSGWYGGTQGRFVSSVEKTGQRQPACLVPAGNTGLKDCSNWTTSHTLTTTADWVSGVYLIRLVRVDNGADSHVLLVVRNDNRCVDLSYVVPVTTYQAYNAWGGKSVYNWNSTQDHTVAGAPRAVKVSFDRPYDQATHDWYTEVDVQNVSWLERQGYNLSYDTSLDLHRGIPHLPYRKALISASHDEYWSKEMRQRATVARDGGVSLLFLGSNAVYWKVRFEGNPTGPDRVMVVYKSTESGGPDPSGEPTGTWRDPAGANQPENALQGQQYVGDNGGRSYPLGVTAEQGKHWMWRNTTLAQQGPGGADIVGQRLVGWEWNARASNGQAPDGVEVFAATAVEGNILQDAGRVYAWGPATQESTTYQAASGAWIVAAGTNHWSRGLGYNAHRPEPEGEPDAAIMQATANALRKMDAGPSTPDSVTIDSPASPPRCPPPPPQPPPTGPGGDGGAGGPGPGGNAAPPSGSPPTADAKPRLPGVAAGLKFTSIKRRGVRVLVKGTIARGARGKVKVMVGRHKATAVIRNGRWSARIRINRRARHVSVRVAWAGNAEIQPATITRKARLRTRS